MKAQSSDKLILGHLNINSIRNKFEALKFIIGNNIDILLISETKLDDSFPSVQFLIKGFSAPYRFHRNSMSGGLLFYIREEIPSKILTYSSNCDIETLLVEINLRKRKWLLNGSYNPNKSQISHHLECLNSLLDEHSKKYENFVFIGDFNVNTSDSSMKEFCSLNGLKNLINEPTCYKNSEKPTCIDLILTNQPTLFQRSAVLETGLSDFHLLTVTEFKMSFQKCKPRIITYRNYKNYDNDVLRSEIQTFCSLNKTDLGLFKESIFCIFNKLAPIRKKYLRANEDPFMTKELHNAIMKRSRYRNKFLKDKSQTSRENYKIQRNLCKKLLRKTKKSYFESLNTKKITDNRTFWKTVVPLFTNKASRGEKIILTEAEKHISDDKKICNVFNNFFSKVVSDLKIPDYYNYFSQENTCSLSLSQLSLKRLKNTPVFSILKKETCFSIFIQDLNAKKSCQTSDTPTKIIKLNCDIFSNLTYKHFNCCIDKGEFPNDLKHTNIVPIYKKNKKCKKENYIPVSVLSNLSKIYEKLMYNQLYEYFDNILFPSQYGFRKGYSAQHCLLVMIEKFKEAIDRGYEFGALLTDLSKAFDCINHPLLIAKLYNYGVSPLSINLIFSYLNNRTHRTKINNYFSERSRIEHVVPQGSILGPLLFNIDLIDLFYECEESNIASYADDTTPYSCARDTQTVISELNLSLANFFTGSSIIILKPIQENVIYF